MAKPEDKPEKEEHESHGREDVKSEPVTLADGSTGQLVYSVNPGGRVHIRYEEDAPVIPSERPPVEPSAA